MAPGILLLQVLLFFCLLLFTLSNGMDPKRTHYTKAEDTFIINEINNYPDETKPIWGTKLWEEIAKKHNEMRKSNPKLFHQGEFPDIGPPNVLPGELGARYNKDEENFIIEEIMRYPSETRGIYSMKMWKTIAEHYNERRKSNPTVFRQKRTSIALMTHFKRKMLTSRGKVRLPDALLQILNIPHLEEQSKFTNKREPSPLPGNYTGTRTWRLSHIRKERFNYKPNEDKFLIDAVLSYPRRPVPLRSTTTWLEIEKHYQERREANPTGFPHVRSAKALEARFLYILKAKLKGQEKRDLIKEIRRDPSDYPINDEEADEDDKVLWADMLEELETNSVDVDFAKLRNSSARELNRV